MSSTIHIGPREYLIRKKNARRWDLAYWCDCTSGPHWHPLDRFARKADAIAAAEAHAEEETR
jgi:hypothetical protein